MKCAPSGAPHVTQIRRDGVRAGRGTWVHKYMDLCKLLGVEEAGKALLAQGCEPDLVAKLKTIDVVARLTAVFGPAVRVMTEHPMALNVENGTGRHLPVGGRDYTDCTENEIPLTIDLIWETESEVYVVDYKTSVDKTASELLLAHTWQLNVAGLAWKGSRMSDKPIKLVVIHIDDDMNLRKAERPFDVMDQDEALLALRKRAGELATSQEYNAGDHCKYCPRYDTCDATVGLFKLALKAQGADVLNGLAPADMYTLARRLKALGDAAEARMKDIARTTPIDLGNGKEYGEVVSQRASIDATSPVALRILKEAGAESAVFHEVKASSDSLLEALGGDRKRHREVTEQLKSAGAMRVTTFRQLRERKIA